MHKVFLEKPCRCDTCQGETDELSSSCKYKDVSPRAVTLCNAWFLYVEEGNTPLSELPAWVAEVGTLIKSYRTKKELRTLIDREEKDKCKDLLKQYGL